MGFLINFIAAETDFGAGGLDILRAVFVLSDFFYNADVYAVFEGPEAT